MEWPTIQWPWWVFVLLLPFDLAKAGPGQPRLKCRCWNKMMLVNVCIWLMIIMSLQELSLKIVLVLFFLQILIEPFGVTSRGSTAEVKLTEVDVLCSDTERSDLNHGHVFNIAANGGLLQVNMKRLKIENCSRKFGIIMVYTVWTFASYENPPNPIRLGLNNVNISGNTVTSHSAGIFTFTNVDAHLQSG